MIWSSMESVSLQPACELVACDICGGSSFTPQLVSRDGACYVACANCGLVFVNPRVAADSLRAVYDDYAEGYYLPRVRDIGLTEGNDEILRQLEAYAGARGQLLDVGCSLGNFLVAARRRDWQVSGIEIAHAVADYARREHGLDVLTGTLPEARVPDNSHDVVTLWACLEHTPNPSENLHHAYRVLRPSGVLALTVPNWSSLSVRLLRARYRYLCRDHLYLFSPGTIRKILENQGFEILNLTTNHFSPLALREDWRSTTHTVSSPDLWQEERRIVQSVRSRSYLLPVRCAWRTFCRALFSANLGDNLLVFARKPAK
jgi:2-polyprenyl-3-methyl-5-hydroxy-6-metoxy-1,4-benzoquinol methylase